MSSEPSTSDIRFEHNAMVERVIGHMQAADDPLSLDDLAEIAGLSPFYFTRIFRDITGIPPGEFRNAIRFDRAKKLLMTTPASITDICFEVGYQSLGTFSSRFKALVGVSPADFRNLPDIASRVDFNDEITRWDPTRAAESARIQGTVTLPDNLKANVYIGLYPASIAAARPIAGTMIPDDRPYMMHQVPEGAWVLLAAAIPRSDDVLIHLLPGSGVMLATGGVIVVTSDDDVITRDLTFRPPNPTDAPVLTALPALLL